MKMKLLDRLILRFGAVLTLLTGGIAVAAGKAAVSVSLLAFCMKEA